ncbi:MAG: hemagglutinin, partial [Deltaproteobacteria bacterium]|nr:hemagglutinin [Kofleriaceae bacterium]
GVATFDDLSLARVGTYTLGAGDGALTAAPSLGFSITNAAAHHLAFVQEPQDRTAGVALTPPPTVEVRDAFENRASDFVGSITMSRASGPAAGVLSGDLTESAVGGLATFDNLVLDEAGTYTLQAASGALTAAVSSPFDILAGSATRLVYDVQPPAASAAGAGFTVVVHALDENGNVDPGYAGSVGLAIQGNPAGGTLSGTTPVTAVAGVATFSGMSIDRAGSGYVLRAFAQGLLPADSTTFDIVGGPATHLVLTSQPSTTAAGQPISPAVAVEARDAFDNVATGFGGDVTIAIANNPGSSTLGGVTTLAATAGVATFATLTLDKVGTGYTLTASSTVTGATSSAFDVTPATADHLVFSVQPTTTEAGQPLAPAVVVRAVDAFDNLATGFDGDVTIAIGANPGSSTLGGTATVAAVAGVATFATLTLDRAGTGYTLTASSTVTGATSAAFDITPSVATRLAFAVEPITTPAGQALAPAVQVEALDAFGNRATAFAGTITIALGANPSGATLAGTTSGVAAAGVHAFGDLSLDRTGTGYTLVASAPGLTDATSASFDVTSGMAASLVFAVQPSDGVAGAAITPAIRVEVHDDQGNVVTTFADPITLALETNPGGATLAGTATQAAASGVALFADLSLDLVGTGYELSATASGLTTAVSTPFAITPAVATQLAVLQQPAQAIAGQPITPAVQLAALDDFGNQVTDFTGDVTVALESNPGSATLGGTTTVAAASGVASFATLTVDRAAVGYTLRATSAGLTAVDTDAFDVVSGTAASLAFDVQPGDVVAGVAFSPALTVVVRDAQGNVDATFDGDVTLAISNNPGAATLAGTLSVAVANGTATFDDVSLDKVGVDYTLAASAAGLAAATSAAFDVTPAAAATYVQSGLAANVPAAIAQAVTFTAHDAFGNVATGYGGTANLTSTDAELEAPATVTFTAGVAAAAELAFHTPGVQMVTLTDQTTASVTATFDTNVMAVPAPTVEITFPADGDEVGGDMVEISATGAVGAGATLVSIEILVDGVVIGEDTAVPFSAIWDASGEPIGSAHVLTARITDSEGNVATSAEVTVTIMANEDGCCSAGGDPTSPVTLAGMVLLAVLVRRRRRRPLE